MEVMVIASSMFSHCLFMVNFWKVLTSAVGSQQTRYQTLSTTFSLVFSPPQSLEYWILSQDLLTFPFRQHRPRHLPLDDSNESLLFSPSIRYRQSTIKIVPVKGSDINSLQFFLGLMRSLHITSDMSLIDWTGRRFVGTGHATVLSPISFRSTRKTTIYSSRGINTG